MDRSPRIIKARFQSKCRECGKTINRGEEIIYHPDTRTAEHYHCGIVKFQTEQADRAAEQWDEEQHELNTRHLGM